MSYLPELGRSALVASGEHVRAVGWLHPDHPFAKGDVSKEFMDRLNEFIGSYKNDDFFNFPGVAGLHCCEFCAKVYGGGNLGLPCGDLLYVFPDMIVHYVEKHSYRPPQEFVDALLSSPLPDSEEFFVLTEPFWQLHNVQQEHFD